MEGIALTDEDRAILALETGSVAGHTWQLNFGFCSDPVIVGDLDLLAHAVEAEAHALLAAAR